MEAEIISELPAKIFAARERIRANVLKTPLMYSPCLSQTSEVYLKLADNCFDDGYVGKQPLAWEEYCAKYWYRGAPGKHSEQTTGSFKLRGAFNKIMSLKEREPGILEKGCTTASSGNHALACLKASKACNCKLQLFCPTYIASSKKDPLLAMGADLVLYGEDCVEAELKARNTAESCGMTYISPYNDWEIIAGQGTIGVEILEDLPDVECVLVAVGGGGLIGGIATYLKSKNKNIEVIGCQPDKSKVMYESIQAGKITHGKSYDTLSDGTAGDIEEDSVSFPLCRDFVDRWILVSEEEIARAVFYILDNHHKVIEGAAGVAVAAFLSNQESFKGKKVVILICGANINTNTLKTIIQKYSD